MKKVTKYENVDPSAPHIHFFWEVLEEFDDSMRSKFIDFCWARSRLPSSIDNFMMPFKICPANGMAKKKPDLHLPKSQTCFFSISLPAYSSKDILRKKIIYAIENSPNMDADVIERNASVYQNLG